jgi:hypothetical protein
VKPSCCWWWRWPKALAPVLEPPAIIASLDDIAMVGDAVEECGGHLGFAEHGGPFAEREVGGDDHRGPLVEFADKMEQQLAARARERQTAEFVEDDEIEPGELGGECAGLANAGLLLEPGDQIDGVEVAATGTGADDAVGYGDGKMSLAGGSCPGWWCSSRLATCGLRIGLGCDTQPTEITDDRRYDEPAGAGGEDRRL